MAACLLETGADPLASGDIILEWKVFEVGGAKPYAPFTCETVVRTLDELGIDGMIRRCHRVVIEKQLAVNHLAKRLEHYMEMYCVMQGKTVTILDPKLRLAYASTTPYWTSGLPESWTVYQRKRLAEKVTARFLEMTHQDPLILERWRSARKKDDLADAFLQASAFVHVHMAMEKLQKTEKKQKTN